MTGPDSPAHPCRWESSDRLVCRLRVQPRASRAGVAGTLGDRLKLGVHAPAVQGAANRAVVRWAADTFGVPPSAVEITSGQATREKTIRIVSPRKIPVEIAAHIAPGHPA
jgi:uncharacterized protein (TIGR00251 family)